VLVAGGGSDEPEGATTQAEAPPRTTGRRVVNGSIGATIARPAGWRARSGGRSIDLRDAEGATALSVSLPAGTDRSAAVLAAAVDGVKRSYEDVEVDSGGGKELGGLPAVSAVVHARNRNGVELDLLLSAVQGRKRSWLVQVVSGADRRGGRGLVEAQVALGTLVLRG
jgi:hypothetical protein